jgi:hypothetical protein
VDRQLGDHWQADVPYRASPGVEVRNTTMQLWRTSIRGGDLAGETCDECGGPGGQGILAVLGGGDRRQSAPANRFAIGNPVLVTVTH